MTSAWVTFSVPAATTNAPTLTHAVVSQGTTLIVGYLIGTPMITYRIEFFAGDHCETNGSGGGQRFLGFTTATPDETSRGPFAFTVYEVLPIPSVVTATASSTQGGTSLFSNCQPVTSPQSVDLSVRQIDSPDPASLLSNITYTITVSNAGPSRATNVMLEDVYPYEAGIASIQLSQGTWSNDERRVLCCFGNLTAGTSAWARIAVNPSPYDRVIYYPAGGYYTNRVTVSSDNIDSAPWNNASEEVTEVGFCDAGVSVSLGPPPYRAGVPFTATLHITNTGPDLAQALWVFLWNNGSEGASIVPDSLTVSNLLPRTSSDIPITVVPLNTGRLSFQASLYAFSQPDPNPTNNSFSLESYAEPGPGVLTFEREAYAIQENGAAIVRVIRTGGSEGTLSAAYATSDGTATGNSDYIPSAGRLVFVPGQTAAQITVRAVTDVIPECNELFSVYLFSADGTTVVAPRTNALISIAERPPRLAGYVRPVTINPTNTHFLVGQASSPVSLSADGKKLAFVSSAPELSHPLPPYAYVLSAFLRDLDARTTIQVTPDVVDRYGFPIAYYSRPALSGDGQTIACLRSLYTNGLNLLEISIRDLQSGSDMIASQGLSLDYSDYPMISSNGATVVFSDAPGNLYAFGPLTRSRDMIDVTQDGTIAPNSSARSYGISSNGRFVLFSSSARLVPSDTNQLTDVYIRDLLTGATQLVSSDTNGLAAGFWGGATMSSDGRWIAFVGFAGSLTGDLSLSGPNIFLRDMLSGTTRVISTNSAPYSYAGDPSMSADGRVIAYRTQSWITNNTETYVADTQSRTVTRVPAGCSGTSALYDQRLSSNGRFLFFTSSGIDLTDGEFLPNDSNIFRWDRLSGETTLVSVNKDRTGAASGWKTFDALSYDGNVLAFTSDSPDFVFGDTNNSYDVFVWEAGTLPQLDISVSNGIVTISWPSDSPPAMLETRTPESEWLPAIGPVQEESGRYLYQTAVGAEAVRFFQLRLL